MSFRFKMGESVKYRASSKAETAEYRGTVLSRVNNFKNNPHAPAAYRDREGGPFYFISGAGRYLEETELQPISQPGQAPGPSTGPGPAPGPSTGPGRPPEGKARE